MSAKPKALLAWSSGKDSAWSLHVLRAQGEVEVVGLLTTINEAFDRVAMHAVRTELLRAQADAADLPLWPVPIPWPCSNAEYEAAMAAAMARARADGITHVAFGDLFLEDVRRYREERLAPTGITPLFPIWGTPTDALARRMIDGGLRARLTCVDPKSLDARFAGREFDAALLAELPASVDPCGERGEFHTFAYDGPMFRRPVPIRAGEVVTRDGFVFADLLPSEVSRDGRELDGEAGPPDRLPAGQRHGAGGGARARRASGRAVARVRSPGLGEAAAGAQPPGVRHPRHQRRDRRARARAAARRPAALRGRRGRSSPRSRPTSSSPRPTARSAPSAPATSPTASRAKLERHQVVALATGTVDGILDGFARVAEVLGAAEAGRALVADIRARLAAVAAVTRPLPRPRVACLEWIEPLFEMGNWGPEIVEIAGRPEPARARRARTRRRCRSRRWRRPTRRSSSSPPAASI